MITTPIKKSYQDYMQLTDDRRYELIEGELLMTPSPAPIHQRVAHRLNHKISQYVDQHRPGEVYFAPLDVVLSNYNVVQPDILYISNARKGIIEDKNIQGPPDLAVEIISPYSIERDRLIKKDLYARYGVQEFWLVDFEKKCIEVLTLKENRYELVGIFFSEDQLSTPLFPSLNLSVGPIFERD